VKELASLLHLRGGEPVVKYKTITKANSWRVCYFVYDKKVIEVVFSAKNGDLAGWCQRLLFWQAG
jgi:hypothetical protein